MNDEYSDIMNLPHPEPANHPRMPRAARAAQFAPFAALNGFEESIGEEARLTDGLMALDSDSQHELDRRMTVIREHIQEHPLVTVVHFVPDERKAGGHYSTVSERILKIDDYERAIVLGNGMNIPFRYIADLQGSILEQSGDD